MNKKLLAFTLAVTLVTAGCSAAWLTTFDSYVALAAPILEQILEIVALAKGTAVSQTTLDKINKNGAAITAIAQSINTASAANLPTACADLNAAVATFAADAPSLESIGQLSNPTTQAQVIDALALFQGVVQEIEAPIAACQTNDLVKATRLTYRVTSPGNLARRYNAIMRRDPATKKYRVHAHSAPVRWVTLGRLQ